jgi:hypothetical protein
MEDVLDLYTQEHPEDEPLICMDEASKQLLRDSADTLPIPMAPGRPRREDYHYERRGTQALFMFFDPVRGWRRVAATDSRTRVDWAEQIRHLLDVDFPKARAVKLVCDNLNTHSIASLYEAFPAAEAHRLARRLEIHYTPRNGSWLNVAEIELSALARQCLDRRLGSADEMRAEVAAWAADRNATQTRVRWRLTTDQARIRLRHLYPQFET